MTEGVVAFVPTFRRNSALQPLLDSVAEQSLPPMEVVVVDNDASPSTRAICESHRLGTSLTYLATPHNEGPAGASARAMGWVLKSSRAPKWLLRLDDDRPLPGRDFLHRHVDRADRLLSIDPRLGAVGLDGASWDWRWCRLRPRSDGELVEVDYLKTGHFPLYRLDMVRDVGTFRPDLFFGMTEVEYGLRIRQRGWTQWAVGPRPPTATSPVNRLTDWRRYYSIRNTVVLLRDNGRPASAWRIGFSRALLRPLLECVRSPSESVVGARLGVRALRDANARRMGRVIDPESWSRGEAATSAEMPRT